MSETLTQPEFNVSQEIADGESARRFVEGLVQSSLLSKNEGTLPQGVTAIEYSPAASDMDHYDLAEQVQMKMTNANMVITSKAIELQIPNSVNDVGEEVRHKLYGADVTDRGFVMHGVGYEPRGQEASDYNTNAEKRFIDLTQTAQKILLGKGAEFEGVAIGGLVETKNEEVFSPKQVDAANNIAKLMSSQR